MKSKQTNKTLKSKTGRDILGLLSKKADHSVKSDVQSPEGETQITLHNFWKSLLGIDNFGVKDDFFQSGGNSLKAIQLLSRISSHFSVQLEIPDIFLKPTISQLADLIESKQKEKPSDLSSNLIVKQDRPSMIPLSFGQERLFFIDQLEGSVQYHIPAVIRLKGKIDKSALSNALREIVNRHEVLRTVFTDEDGKAYQKIREKDEWHLGYTDGKIYRDDSEGLQKYIQQLINSPFDISKDHMLRADLITLEENEFILVLTMHHIASDGWSISVLVKEVIELYSAYSEDRTPALSELPLQYADYAIWQRKYLTGEILDKKIDFWKENLAGSSALQLPTDHPRPSLQSIRGAEEEFHIEKELTDKLMLLTQQYGTTLFMSLLSVFKILLYRYSGQSDISVGTPVAGRHQQEQEELIGFFVNTLVLRNEVNGNSSFKDLLLQVRTNTLKSFEHQDVPFEKIVDSVVKERDLSRSPLFQVMFILQNTPEVENLYMKDAEIFREPEVHDTSKFELTFSFTETSNGLQGLAEYCTDLYSRETILKMTDHFKELLKAVLKFPEQSIDTLAMLNEQEENKILNEFNDTDTDYPEDSSIIELFNEQVVKNPDKTALIFEDEQLTYKELNERSNQLAHYLKSKGLEKGTLVPVCIERSIDLMVAILGILKTGCAYVPIDPEYPEDRIRFMLKDTEGSMIICSKECLQKLPELKEFTIIETDASRNSVSKQPDKNLSTEIQHHDLAYVIYTSGSTGRPKGVMVTHRNVVSLVKNVDYVTLTDEDILLSTGSSSFDATTIEYWGMLLNGGQLILCSENTLLDSTLLKDEIEKRKVNIMWFTSSWFNQLVDNDISVFESLKTIMAGGEKLSEYHIEKMRKTYPAIEIINGYGPTENTTFSLTYRITETEINKPVPIGRPLNNRKAYILNQAFKPVPVGVAGEIYLGGAGLSKGYLNRPELTSEKFVNDPYGKYPGAKIYKTGDLGRWLPDGNIEYLGRMDDQVKIRGYRIELGEIESVLQECEFVRQSVVLVKETKEGVKRLTGYVVPEGEFDKDKIINHLRKRLPDYMVPALWVEMESLPLTQNGKTDRNALPDPDISELLRNEYADPRNELEENLVSIWKDLLKADRVGIHDNFFELGGDSIITIQVVSRARRMGYELKPKDIFIHQTIGNLSQVIAERSASPVTGEQGYLKGSCGLLPVQQSYFEESETDISHFNQSVLLKIDKKVSAKELNIAIEQLTSHHDALRFKYENKKGYWTQEYGVNDGVLLTVDLISAQDENINNRIKEKEDDYQKSLDIKKGEITRFVLFKTPESETHNRLLIVIHHLAVDGVSWRILLDDLELLLKGIQSDGKADLGTKGSSYRQWYKALEDYGKSNRLLSQKNYWKKTEESFIPMTTDKTFSGAVKVKDTETITLRIDPEQTRLLLQEIPGVYHTEINDILLCSLALTLCEQNSSEKIVIGMEGHGRENISEGIDTSRTTGWFTSIYPVLIEILPGIRLPDSIKSVKEQLRRMPDKGIGYGVLKYLNKYEELSNKNCWEIVFNYLGQLDNISGSGKLLSEAGESGKASASDERELGYKLAVNGMITGGELIINWSYSKLHFEEKTISELSNRYQSILNSIIVHCMEQQKSGNIYTPSDYGLGADVGYEELDRFMDETYKGIARRESVEGLYRLSSLQQGMLFHGIFDESAGAYTEQLSCDIRDPDSEIIKKAWNYVLSNHSILRSGFYYDVFSVPVQCVYREVEIPLSIIDHSDLNPEQQSKAIKEYESADRLKGFDFKSVPLMRIGLIRLNKNLYRMLWTSHHILFDGWSLPVLMEEFLNAYELISSGKETEKKEEDRFEDYIRYLDRLEKDSHEIYWRNYMKGVEHSTLLPFIGATAQRNSGTGEYKTINLKLETELAAEISFFAQKNRLTVNTIMQGVWAYLLHRYTGSSDVVYGVIVSGRPDDLPGIEQRVGLFINTLPLHSVFNNDERSLNRLQEIQKQQVLSIQHQYTSLQEIQKWTGISGDLFDSLLVFENYPVSDIISSKKWSLKVDNIKVEEQTNYPLTLIINSGEEINISFSYNTELLSKESMNLIRSHFENVLRQMVSNAEIKTDDINILTGAEEKLLLSEFNDTSSEYPKSKSTSELFEDQVKKSPDNIALVFEDQQMTYKELDERSNQVANLLIGKGVQPGENIGLLSLRGFEMITSMIGILKAGCAYVPFNTDYPLERLKFIIEDTEIKHIVTTDDELISARGLENYDCINVKDSYLGPVKSPGIKSDIDSCMYVMFTSGTTGRPKGIAVSHRNVIKLVYDTGEISVKENDRVLQWSNYSFDGSTYDIYSSLLTGASLYLIKDDWASNADELTRIIIDEKITVCFITTALFNAFVDVQPEALRGLRKILFGGEMVSLSHVTKAFSVTGEGKIVHVYGPTETTVYATGYSIHEIRKDGIIPIGKPLSNTSLYVLDESRKPVPLGVAGELYIGGDGVSLGYVNNAELTKEKFVTNPFGKNKSGKLYRTGDIVRWLPEGVIEYLGRIDDQVKVRGFRIELGEIESVLLENEKVKQAVVIAKNDKLGTKKLVCYIVTQEKFDKTEIITYLKSKLPDYMIPAIWIEMESMPLNTSGKIDKKALPEPDITDLASNEYVAPRNETEEKLAEIWKELLGVERIGIHDNFFEMGGHSLLAMRVISMIRKELKSELSVREIFSFPTIAELSVQLETQSRGNLLPAITSVERPEYIPLSFSQERLWFIDKLEGSIHYHIPSVLKLKGKLNKEALLNAMQSIVNRHEVLRTVIKEKDGVGYQFIKEAGLWKLEEEDLRESAMNQKDLQEHLKELINIPFDLSADHMMRGTLIKISDDEYILLVTLHHIASDGWSASIFTKELTELYMSSDLKIDSGLEPLQIQYADYAIWQRNYLQGEVLEKKLDYWRKKLEGIEPLQLPADHSQALLSVRTGSTINFNFDKKLTDVLREYSNKNGASLFMTLLAAFNVLLHRYSGQDDICVGIPISGRQQKETEPLIGFFVNTLALRNDVKSETLFSELLEQVKKTTLEAYDHQEAPFEKVVEAVVRQRDMHISPLFQVMFAMQNLPEAPDQKLNDLSFSRENITNKVSKFDLTLFINETPNGLEGSLEYCTGLFKEWKIVKMINHFNNILRSVIADPDQMTGTIQMLSGKEKHQLLVEFNNTDVEHPDKDTVIDLFERQVKKSPDKIAVVYKDQKLTFRELNVRINQLANYLKKSGVKSGQLIAIFTESSIVMITEILGVLKAGGVYVPIDTEYPEERINFILKDTNAEIILTDRKSSSKLSHIKNTQIIIINEDQSKIILESDENPENIVKPEDLAYVIYTSGSTGTPKGVMIGHDNLILYLKNNKTRYTDEGSGNSGSFIHLSYTFDASLTGIFMPLITGTSIVISSKKSLDVFEDENLIRYAPYDFIKITPSHIDLLQTKIKTKTGKLLTEKLVVGGEALLLSHFKYFIENHINVNIVNEYGPTEATVGSSVYTFNTAEATVSSNYEIPIGKPLDNVKLYILNDSKAAVPIGVAGEIYIAGQGVARGYLNRPDLTREKFIEIKREPGNSHETDKISEYNFEYSGYENEKNIINLFEEQVVRNPDNIALISGEKRITYRELNERSNQLAHFLQNKGVKSETLVPLCIERSIEMVTGILGIMKAGGAYVPIDPEYPEERINFMLEDTAASIVVTSKISRAKLSLTGIQDDCIVEIDSRWPEISKQPSGNIHFQGSPESLAYIIYTSGSTGKPKGVMIENRNVYSFILWCKSEFESSKFEIVYATTSICFDLSVFEIFFPLCTGKPLRILENGLQIGKYSAKDKMIMTNCVPGIIETLLKEGADFSNVSAINMAGEPISVYVQENLDLKNKEVRNLYGPTEDTTYSTIFRLNDDKPLMIGKPISNSKAYILNKEQVLNPVGVAGEIYLSGDGISRGYLNRKELTAEKFIRNPFIREERMYRTGDLGRWLPDGNIEYLGRMDHQVKIRGFRIELGEIESVLQESGLVSQVAVVANDDKLGGKRLIGYIVPKAKFDKEEIMTYLSERLPEYMIPAVWVEMERLPLTTNGKLDKKALPDPVLTDMLSNEYTAPRNSTEAKLADIWQELLSVERAGVYDNFFELGGHSLLAMRVISAVKKEFELDLSIKDFFLRPTIAELAIFFDTMDKGSETPAVVAEERPEFIPLSFSQERLWFLDKLEGSTQYHLPSVLRLKGNLNKDALEYALRNIVNRHEVLRTVMLEKDGKSYQHVNEKDKWNLNFIDGSAYKNNEIELRGNILQIINSPFDLTKDSMMRGHLIRISENENLLILTLHHIASDGWSVSILVNELIELYKSFTENRESNLEPVLVQYADYSIWQRNYLQGEVLDKKLDYWKKKLENAEPLNLPTDYTRPAIQSINGALKEFTIDKELTDSLHLISRKYGVTLFMTLLSAFKVMLFRYSNQEDICVGSPIAGRQQEEIEKLIGFFVSTVTLRSTLRSEENFTEVLEQVKTTTLEAYEHQDTPFEKVVEAVVKHRDMSRNPLFQVGFGLEKYT